MVTRSSYLLAFGIALEHILQIHLLYSIRESVKLGISAGEAFMEYLMQITSGKFRGQVLHGPGEYSHQNCHQITSQSCH